MSRASNIVPFKQEKTVASSPAGDESWRLVLARIKKAVAGAQPIHEKPSRFRPMPGQPRTFFDDSALARLSESIAEVGQVQFGMARRIPEDENGATYELLDGERRWRVVSKLGLDTYRALLVEIDDEAAPFIVAAISNFHRESHTATEISDAIHKLRTGLKVPMPEIAKIFGFSEFYTYQLHGLQNLHTNVRAMLDPRLAKDRILPTTAAIQLSKLDPDLQEGVANKILGRELSLRSLRTEVVRVGEVHGKPVRTRDVALTHQWASVRNMTRGALESTRAVRDKLADPGSARLLAERGNEQDIVALLSQLDETIKFAGEAQSLLRASLKK